MLADLSALQVALTVVAVVAGAIVQGSVGMGFGTVLVPVLAVVAPAMLPATVLLLAFVLTGLMVLRERAAIDASGIPLLLVGRMMGTGIAVWLLVSLSQSALEILFGVVIVGVVALSALKPSVRPTLLAKLTAGTASGLFSTTAGIGGAPVAVLYQTRPGPQLRSTLAAFFLLGIVVSLSGLLAAGRLSWTHVGLAVVLAPALVGGFALSRPLARFLDARWLRPAVLLFAAAGRNQRASRKRASGRLS